MRQKLNLITLGVKDLAASERFFTKLNWKKSSHSVEGLVLFPLGGITLALHPRKDLAADAGVTFDTEKYSPITLSLNTKSEQEVDDVLKEALSAGAKLIKPGQKVYWGGYSGYFEDLDGNLFEVAFNPFWELDEADNLLL